jgi:hypothetical protein
VDDEIDATASKRSELKMKKDEIQPFNQAFCPLSWGFSIAFVVQRTKLPRVVGLVHAMQQSGPGSFGVLSCSP